MPHRQYLWSPNQPGKRRTPLTFRRLNVDYGPLAVEVKNRRLGKRFVNAVSIKYMVVEVDSAVLALTFPFNADENDIGTAPISEVFMVLIVLQL